jgi:hypothetical protein
MLYSLVAGETDLRKAFLHFLAHTCQLDSSLQRSRGRARGRRPRT